MKYVLKLEEAIQFMACMYILYLLEANWWIYLLLLLGPDIGMLGYLAGNKPGAVMYNLFHHKGLALILAAAGLFWDSEVMIYCGLILFGHAAMDRMFGFGLK